MDYYCDTLTLWNDGRGALMNDSEVTHSITVIYHYLSVIPTINIVRKHLLWMCDVLVTVKTIYTRWQVTTILYFCNSLYILILEPN